MLAIIIIIVAVVVVIFVYLYPCRAIWYACARVLLLHLGYTGAFDSCKF